MISKGPKNFSASFLVGSIVLKNCALTNVRFPTLKSGAGSNLVSAEIWYALLSIENSLAKFLMKFVQIHNKVLNSRRSEVTFRMDGEVWVVAFIGKERQDSSCRTGSIIVGEF